MLKPTQDKQLRKAIAEIIIRRYIVSGSSDTLDELLSVIEKLGYHKGLPPSIEEALNSGDGAYRP